MDSNKRSQITLAITFLLASGGIKASDAPSEQVSTQLPAPMDACCEICADDKSADMFSTLTCSHTYCNECLNHILDGAIRAKSSQELKCPHSECASKLGEQDIRIIAHDDAAKMAAYADITTQEWLATQRNAKFCPTPECPYAFINERDRRCAITCQSCKREYCAKCLAGHKIELDCTEVMRDGSTDTKDLAWKHANTKPCPTCRTSIEKNDGCLHMTCGKCTTKFCWHCLNIGHDDSHVCHKKSPQEAHRILSDQLPKIINAAISDNTRLFDEAMAEGCDVNIIGPQGNSPLTLACTNMSFEVAYRLLENPATNVNVQNDEGNTALIIACQKNNFDIVEAIFEHGDVNTGAQNELGETALEQACKVGNLELVKLLLSKGADVNLSGPLYTAITKKHVEIIQALLQSPGIQVTHDHFVLACAAGDIDIAKSILARISSDINFQNSKGETALSSACKNNNAEIVKMLLAYPEIDVNLGDPLSHAISNNSHDMIRLLMEQPNLKISQYHLSNACKKGNIEVVKYLLSIPNIDINAKGDTGDTTLHYALKYTDIPRVAETIDLLLYDSRIDINLENAFGDTAESIAAKWNPSAHRQILLMKPFLSRVVKFSVYYAILAVPSTSAACRVRNYKAGLHTLGAVTGLAALSFLGYETYINFANAVQLLKTNPDYMMPKKQAEIKRCLTTGCLTGLGTLGAFGIAALTIKAISKQL